MDVRPRLSLFENRFGAAPRVPDAWGFPLLDALIGITARGGRGLVARRLAVAALPLLRQLGLPKLLVGLAPLALVLARALESRRPPGASSTPPPTLLRLLAEAGLSAARRAFEPRGRWGLRRLPDTRNSDPESWK